MKLSAFIKQLQRLEAEGHGDCKVFYAHGSSGDTGELSSARVTDERSDQGPFNLRKNEKYVSIYAGN